jgi:hypothetical protein
MQITPHWMWNLKSQSNNSQIKPTSKIKNLRLGDKK